MVESPQKPKILLVEDDLFLIRAYQIKLESEGFELTIAKDATEGMEKVRTAHPDLVLLDVMLPHGSGFEILEAVKKDEMLRHIPVIILSNLGQQQDIERGLTLGAATYLIKTDVKLEDVVKTIKKYLTKV